MRRFGGKVIWLRNLTNPETFRSWSTHYGRMKPEIIDHRKRGLAKDSHGFQLWHELDARDEDLWVEKTRYSAFIEGASNISKLLWTHGIDTLLLCGVEALNVKPFDVLSNFVPGGATRPVASRESRSSSSAEICSEILKTWPQLSHLAISVATLMSSSRIGSRHFGQLRFESCAHTPDPPAVWLVRLWHRHY